MTLNELQENLKRKGYTSEEIDIWTAGHQSGGNYTANDSTFPTEVTFQNGRKVGIAFDGDKPYLTIGWRGEELEGGDEMTDELKEAVDRLKDDVENYLDETINGDLDTVLAALERETARADRAEAVLRGWLGWFEGPYSEGVSYIEPPLKRTREALEDKQND